MAISNETQVYTRILQFSACALAIFTEYTAWTAVVGDVKKCFEGLPSLL